MSEEVASQSVIDAEVFNQFVMVVELAQTAGAGGEEAEGLPTGPHPLGSLCWGAGD